ncbi:MAG: glycosyltransferase family 2 protein [Saprospiraceae bacterium]|nr:glycosyltransferase family 2 protein [Saprospiraceae bacterium]
MSDTVIDVIIPAYNEESSVGRVIKDIPSGIVRHIIVCNNNSNDNTAGRAEEAGAIVVEQPDQGYGNACLAGMSYISSLDKLPDVVVFLDADYSDYPEEMKHVVKPIIEQGYDMVIGSRALGDLESGAMMPQQIFGNWLATNMIKLFYGYEFTDLGPFRAIKWDQLMNLNMIDKTYGWTVEMQVKAAKHKLKCTEVPVTYRKRIGKSKVSGTVKGTIMAGHKILWTIFKLL